jgi:hypothetical protein
MLANEAVLSELVANKELLLEREQARFGLREPETVAP